jgi:hypothetical protein
MERRQILKYAAFATGAAITAPFAGAFLTGCAREEVQQAAADRQRHYFAGDDYDFLQSFIDTLLPATDSPSATGVGVDGMIDATVGLIYDKEQQADFKTRFSALRSWMGEQSDLATAFEQLEQTDARAPQPVINGYSNLKQQAISFYLATEPVATEFLNYLPVPGPYRGCIPVSDVDNKAWAL